MLIALALPLAAIAALRWRIRELLRPGRPCGRLGHGIIVIFLGCGSTVLFFASRSIVYHEPLLWGHRVVACGLPPPAGSDSTAHRSASWLPVSWCGTTGETPHQQRAGLVGRLAWLGANRAPAADQVRWAAA